jgi:Rrf2 family protein
MISQTAEYALRAIVLLAMHPETGFTTQQIAQATKVPPAYLSKVLQSLVKAGLLRSQRGLRGGFALNINPLSISILTVINAVDPIARIRTCPLGFEEHGVNLCALHKRLDEAAASMEQAFEQTTIRELLARPTGSIPFCEPKAAD